MTDTARMQQYELNLDDCTNEEQKNLLKSLDHHLDHMALQSKTHDKIPFLGYMLSACSSSAILKHADNSRQFESLTLALVEEGLDHIALRFQRDLVQPAKNFRDVDVRALLSGTPKSFSEEDQKNIADCRSEIERFKNFDAETWDAAMVDAMMTALQSHSARIDAREKKAVGELAYWLMDAALFLLIQIGRAVSVLFEGWEVQMLKQSIPGTGSHATCLRPAIATKVPKIDENFMSGASKGDKLRAKVGETWKSLKALKLKGWNKSGRRTRD